MLPDGPLPASLHELNDSKKLKALRRDRLAAAIARCAITVGVGVATHDEIDEINILEATRLAMRRAIEAASRRWGHQPATLLIDGHLPVPGLEIRQLPLVKGDGRSWAIAAASVVAKVTRDRMMTIYDRSYPAYGFAQHKGYGTVAHREAMHIHGICPIHRKSFKWSRPEPR